jgi:formate--tetrahydrofolate ligase
MRALSQLTAALGIDPDAVQPWGPGVAKLRSPASPGHGEREAPDGRLILVSAMSPTPLGEGKTTVAIGLADGLAALGERVVLSLREPSLGPCFGQKGGGTGGGKATLEPATRINLHFTGDLHAVASAHNLVAAALDSALHFAAVPDLDPRSVFWPRAIDMNDRALRDIIIGLGGRRGGVPRQTGFIITAASELMAILCLARDADDLRQRVDRIVIGLDREGRPVPLARLGITGAVMALLADALMPNLVQTASGTPALVHGGPFANIAHGASSVLATRLGLRCASWVITEAGFGFDLGGEKFMHIAAPAGALTPAVVVLVATLRALKYHGGVELPDLNRPGAEALRRGLGNLEQHLAAVARFDRSVVVALNRFTDDRDDELELVAGWLEQRGVPVAVWDGYTGGPAGSRELAALVQRTTPARPAPLPALHRPGSSLTEKLDTIVRKVYGGRGAVLGDAALRIAAIAERAGLGQLPVCVAKTPLSLSDQPARRGRPRDFDVHITGLELAAGAGFLVALAGETVRMPGLPHAPRAARIDLVDGQITGLD